MLYTLRWLRQLCVVVLGWLLQLAVMQWLMQHQAGLPVAPLQGALCCMALLRTRHLCHAAAAHKFVQGYCAVP
jgi:hypothetical protein